MKKFVFVLIMLAAVAVLCTACNATKDAYKRYSSGYLSSDSLEESGANTQIPAGQITAAEWNDNRNFDKWLPLLEDGQEETAPGAFKEFLQRWQFNTKNRISVNITKEDAPVCGAVVKVYSGETLLYSATSNANGKAYLFIKSVNEGDSLTIEAVSGGQTVSREAEYENNMEVDIEVAAAGAKEDKLEIMFVVDTTGSMGDELRYLKAEIKDVIGQVKLANPQTEISIALLFYRDIGDDYVTRYFDFNSDIDTIKANISAQGPAGGGDYPEAVHTALSEAVAKQWSTGNSTKLIIHVMDAPPHDNVNDMSVYENSIYTAASKGIRMIPVASSGIDKGTEYLLRNQALLTNGTYVFITDDSGIGGDHIEPTIDGYVVEYLNALLVRVINEQHTGIVVAPVPYSQ
jgi:hypothetical protein